MKVLDFGLARSLDEAGVEGPAEQQAAARPAASAAAPAGGTLTRLGSVFAATPPPEDARI